MKTIFVLIFLMAGCSYSAFADQGGDGSGYFVLRWPSSCVGNSFYDALLHPECIVYRINNISYACDLTVSDPVIINFESAKTIEIPKKETTRYLLPLVRGTGGGSLVGNNWKADGSLAGVYLQVYVGGRGDKDSKDDARYIHLLEYNPADEKQPKIIFSKRIFFEAKTDNPYLLDETKKRVNDSRIEYSGEDFTINESNKVIATTHYEFKCGPLMTREQAEAAAKGK